MQGLLLRSIVAVTFLINLSQANAVTMYSTGTYVPYFDKVQVSNSGATQKFDLNPYLAIGKQFNMSGPHYFMPELGYTYWLETAKKVKKSMIFLHYNFSYILSQRFIFRYGLTTHWYKIKGEGGTVSLRNGDGYTNFKAPDKEVTTYFTTLNLGSEFFFNKGLALRFDLNMMNVNELEQRAYNYLFTVNFYR
jgi:hypothetical protein